MALQKKMEKEGFEFLAKDYGDDFNNLLLGEIPKETRVEFNKRIHAYHAEYLNQRDDDGWEFCGSAGDHWVFRRRRQNVNE